MLRGRRVGRRAHPGPLRRPGGLHAHVVALELQAHAIPHAQPLDVLARKLQATGAIEHGVLARVATAAHRVTPHLDRGASVADADRAAHVIGDAGVVRDDQHRLPDSSLTVRIASST